LRFEVPDSDFPCYRKSPLEVLVKTGSVRADRSSLLARLAVLGVLVLVPGLYACSGGTETPGGSGGSSNNGSGGSTSSGGNSGSGGNTGSGGHVGSGGSNSSGSGGSSSSGGSSGSGGNSGSGGSGSTASCDAPGMVFHDSTVGCLGSGCHSPGSGNQAPDLSGTDGSLLKGMKATTLCAGKAIVNPSDPTSSVLYKVLAGTSCLIQMPANGPPYLNADQLDCVKRWIANIQ
jgi:hypothetical protein